MAVTRDRAYDRRALGIFFLGGIVIDSAYALAGVLAYAAPWPVPGLAPAWLVIMWLNLALTLNHSLAWLRRRYSLAAIFGGIGGGLSYWAGWRLGAVEFYWPAWAAAGLIGLVWAAALPGAYAILERSASETDQGGTPSESASKGLQK
jgi:hypothetical protein